MDNNKSNAKDKMFQDALTGEKDFLKNILQKLFQDILEEEMETHIGAKKIRKKRK